MKAHLRFSLMVFVSLLCGMHQATGQWVETGVQQLQVNCFANMGTYLFAGTYGRGILLSTNNGTDWVEINSSLKNGDVKSLALMGSSLYAAVDSSVLLSADSGKSWNNVSTGLPQREIWSLAVSDTILFAGTYARGIYRSSDRGKNWTEVDSGLPVTTVFSFTIAGTNLYASTYTGLYYSSNEGRNWKNISSNINYDTFWSLAVSGSNLFAGTTGRGVYLSTNNGTSWTEVNNGITGSFGYYIHTLVFSGSNLFAGAVDNVFLTTNNGTNWLSVNDGLWNANFLALTLHGTNLFAGTEKAGIWMRPLSEMVTSVEGNPTELPTKYSINQNFPNPFSASTTISFAVPSPSFVSLKIFDVLGKEITTIVSNDLGVGQHSYQWNAEGLRSGVYLCRLQAGSFVATQKLSLLR